MKHVEQERMFFANKGQGLRGFNGRGHLYASFNSFNRRVLFKDIGG